MCVWGGGGGGGGAALKKRAFILLLVCICAYIYNMHFIPKFITYTHKQARVPRSLYS